MPPRSRLSFPLLPTPPRPTTNPVQSPREQEADTQTTARECREAAQSPAPQRRAEIKPLSGGSASGRIGSCRSDSSPRSFSFFSNPLPPPTPLLSPRHPRRLLRRQPRTTRQTPRPLHRPHLHRPALQLQPELRGLLGRDQRKTLLRRPPRQHESLHRIHAPTLPAALTHGESILPLRLAGIVLCGYRSGHLTDQRGL